MSLLSREKTVQNHQPVLKHFDTYTIQILDTSDETKWDRFVNQQGCHPFHMSHWKYFYEYCLKLKTIYLTVEHHDQIVGVLPLVEMQSWLFGHALISLPFLVYGGPLGEQRACDKLIDKAIEIGEEKQVDYIELKCRDPIVKLGWTQSLYVNFSRPLSQDHDQNLKAIPRKQRAIIRKAENSALVARFERQITDFYQLYALSVKNLGTPVLPKDFFKHIQNQLRSNCSILTVFQDNQPLSSVMSFYHQDTVFPFYGGGNLDARATKANDFMYWTLMKDAVEKGYKVFNFGRSKMGTGSYRFKKHWGFEPEPLYYRTIPIRAKKPPNLNPTNPKYQLLIKAWKRLPLSVSMWLGPWIATRLG